MYKLRNATIPANTTELSDGNLNSMQLHWNSLLSIVNMTPKPIILFLISVWGEKLPITATVIVCVVINTIMFFYNDAFTFINTDGYQIVYMNMTLGSVAVMSTCIAVLQGRFTSVAAMFPKRYMEGFLTWQQVGATLVSILNILVLAFGSDPVSLAKWTFLGGALTVLVSLILFVISSRTRFFREWSNEQDRHDVITEDEETPLIPSAHIQEDYNTLQVAKIIWPWILTSNLLFIVAMSLFPAIAALVESVDQGKVRIIRHTDDVATL